MKKKSSPQNNDTKRRSIVCGEIIRMPYWRGDLNTHLCVLLQVDCTKHECEAMLFCLDGANRVNDKRYPLKNFSVALDEISKTSKIAEEDIKVVGNLHSLLKNFKETKR